MSALLDKTYLRTIDLLQQRILEQCPREGFAEAWVFEDLFARRRAERELARHGITAVFRCAYKPLVHAWTEELSGAPLRAVKLFLPSHERAEEGRFRLESYPLSELIGQAELQFATAADPLTARMELTRIDGHTESIEVFHPNRVRADHLGERVLATCGWIRLYRDAQSQPFVDEPVETEFEQIFDDAMKIAHEHVKTADDLPSSTLSFDVDVPGVERALPHLEERISTAEALAFELYRSSAERMAQQLGRKTGDFSRVGSRPQWDATLQTGRIVPRVKLVDGPARLSARRELTRDIQAPTGPEPALPYDPEIASEPPSMAQVEAALRQLEGEVILGETLLGRAIPSIHVPGPGAGVFLSAGHHANETAGVVAVLRALKRMQGRFSGNLMAVPVGNPDSYDLDRELRSTVHPKHAHGASRYSALGDDVLYRKEEVFETATLKRSVRRVDALLHIDLHSCTSHESPRPLTGYLPRGTAHLTIPKGFYLIIRHTKAYREVARDFADFLLSSLASATDLRAFNRKNLRSFEQHMGHLAFDIRHDIPYYVVETEVEHCPLTLLTEFPEKSTYGEHFRLAHDCHTRTALAALEFAQTRLGRAETAGAARGDIA